MGTGGTTWAEVETAQSEKRREIVLSGANVDRRIKESDGCLDPALFSLNSLNFLEITDCPSLEKLPAEIASLSGLTNLVLRRNSLRTLPPEIGTLKVLKVLDVSGNKLQDLPPEIGQLTQLSTLNISLNAITTLPEELSGCAQLHVLNGTSNKIEAFPVSVCQAPLQYLMEILFSKNNISSIPNSIDRVASLKVLDLSENQIKTVPGELARCLKLKELNMKSNKLSDNRFRKLVEQSGAKPILDYVRQHFPIASPSDGGAGGEGGGKSGKKGGSSGKKKRKDSEQDNGANDGEEMAGLRFTLEVLHIGGTTDTPVTIATTPKIKDVRPHIIACVVRNLDFSSASILKRFLMLQNKLHDTVCEKRNLATLATHDLAKIPSGGLLYDAGEPKQIHLVPLNRQKEVSAQELFSALQKEAEALRKEKKRNTYSGIHTYLYLLENKPLWPFLADDKGRVISFPPITNAEGTKISAETKDVLVEITSSSSLNACKTICDELLAEMVQLFAFDAANPDGDAGANAKKLVVEQVKVTDLEGNLRNVYPSKVDLQTLKEKNIHVIRNF